jgi:hypothetical protein
MMAGLTSYAVLQNEFSGPSVEQLKRVFSSFIHLTDADAVRLSCSARGILMKQLNRDSARAFQRALGAEGFGATIVAERDLPHLPEGKLLHRLEISPQAFVTYDLLGRTTGIDWNDLALVAAGEVRRLEIRKTESKRTDIRSKKVKEIGHKMEWDAQLVLEIVLANGAGRYQIEAAEFPFKYVIDQPELSVPAKFIWLVREICRRTPRAIFNTGAQAILDGQDALTEYESRQALTDEMIWLLWNGSRQTQAQAR